VSATVDKRASDAYGEDIPLDHDALADWCVSRIGAWGTAVGMEAFPEAETGGRRTLVLGGKVLVLDDQALFVVVQHHAMNARALGLQTVRTPQVRTVELRVVGQLASLRRSRVEALRGRMVVGPMVLQELTPALREGDERRAAPAWRSGMPGTRLPLLKLAHSARPDPIIRT